MTLLAQHLDAAGLSQADFAGRVKCSPSFLNELVKGSKKPGLDLAVRIERETRGAVPAQSWVADGHAPVSPQEAAEDAA